MSKTKTDRLTFWLEVAGLIFGVTGAIIVALNLTWSAWGFVSYLAGSVCLAFSYFRLKNPRMLLLWAVYTVINIVGVYRWFFA